VEGQINADAEYYLADDKATYGSKMKRAFCAPTETAFNPPLQLAADIGLELFGAVTVGETKYTEAGAMQTDFVADTLSPQTLKPAMAPMMKELFEAIQASWKPLATEAKLLKAALKKK
jgi:hypothetical protein